MTRCIVIVEDEPSVAEMLQVLLEGQGCSVVAVEYPELVHAIDPRFEPYLFLLDVMLPGLSGIELAAQLRRCGYDRTPIIAMSASPLMLDVAKHSHLFEGTLSKPFDLSKLLDYVSLYAA